MEEARQTRMPEFPRGGPAGVTERGPVIFTSNLGFADWTQVFGEATLTAARLDRLPRKAHIVTCDSESYRLKESLQRQGIGSGKGVKATQKPARSSVCRGPAPAPPEFSALETTGEAGNEKAG